jgi:hypothetical protein
MAPGTIALGHIATLDRMAKRKVIVSFGNKTLVYDRTIFNSSVYIQHFLCVLQYHFITCFGWIQSSSGVPELKLCPHMLK